MIRDITLGQYYQTDSVIHRLDPRVKLVATIAFLCSLFVVKNFIGYLIAAIFLGCMIKLSHVPFRYMIKGMRAITFLLLLTFVFNLFLTPGEVVWSAWKLQITKEGISLAVKMAIRLTFLRCLTHSVSKYSICPFTERKSSSAHAAIALYSLGESRSGTCFFSLSAMFNTGSRN